MEAVIGWSLAWRPETVVCRGCSVCCATTRRAAHRDPQTPVAPPQSSATDRRTDADAAMRSASSMTRRYSSCRRHPWRQTLVWRQARTDRARPACAHATQDACRGGSDWTIQAKLVCTCHSFRNASGSVRTLRNRPGSRSTGHFSSSQVSNGRAKCVLSVVLSQQQSFSPVSAPGRLKSG
jgi:hypothetical protein